MAAISIWVQGARPKTLIASLSPIAIGTSMAVFERHFSFWVFLLTLLTGLSIQILTNYINDLFDFIKGADTKERKGPLRVTAQGLVTLSEMKGAIVIFALSIALMGTLLALRGGMPILVLLAGALLLAFAYTAGPFPLAYLGLAELFILIFFGPIATASTYFLQTLHFNPKAAIAGIAPGLLSSCIVIVNNLRDAEEDKKAEKKTLIVRFGTTFGKWEYTIFLALSFFMPFFLSHHHRPILLTCVCLGPALSLIVSVFQCKDPYAYKPIFEKTAELLFLYTLIFSLGWMI